MAIYVTSDNTGFVSIFCQAVHPPWKLRKELAKLWEDLDDPELEGPQVYHMAAHRLGITACHPVTVLIVPKEHVKAGIAAIGRLESF